MRKETVLLLVTMIFVNSVTSTRTILNDVLDLLPMEKIKQVMKDHLRFDEGFKAGVSFVKTPQWLQMEKNILLTAEFKTFAMTVMKVTVL